MLIEVKPQTRFSLLELIGVERFVAKATGIEAYGACAAAFPANSGTALQKTSSRSFDSPRIGDRLDEILQRIADIKALLSGRQRDFLLQDRVARAAFERFLEIISEASRHVPEQVKSNHPEIP